MHTNDISVLKKVALGVGIVGTCVSAFMTGKFGWEISWVHAAGFVCVTVLAGIMFPFRKLLIARGLVWPARVFSVLGVLFLAGELFGDLGYTIGQRDKSLKTTGHTQVVNTNAGNDVAAAERELAVFEKNLADIRSANPFVTTVSADGLKEMLNSAQMAIDQEAARGGCKTKCLQLTKQRDELANRIKTAERSSDVERQIAATNKKISELKAKVAAAPVAHTPVKSQSDFVAKLYLAFNGSSPEKTLNPDEYTTAFTEIFIGFFIAILATLLPTVAFYMAFIDETEEPEQKATTPVNPMTRPTFHTTPSLPGPAGLILTRRAA